MHVPKGKIVAIGGNVDRGSYPLPTRPSLRRKINFFQQGILERIHLELYGTESRLEIVTTASLIPEEMAAAYVHAFHLLDSHNVGTLHIRSPEEADRPENLERLRKAHGILFTGGDQSRIAAAFLHTQALSILQERYQQEEKFLISGTSAGAMALCNIMIKSAEHRRILAKGTVRLGEGLSLLPAMLIDTHFINRRRMPRLMEAIAAYPDRIGIGLGEDTGVLIRNGNVIETIGSGLVILIDGRQLYENNFPDIPNGEALCLEHLLLHVLPKGKCYLVQHGRFLKEGEACVK
ncbi:cyanophycinase [Pontibacter mangrovi]|uniref:Cyanophycinase n=1 Tax=Pontibacter mangrovi TaxID=2589816 RepID=A0A501W533_9BACT|nr:cyanophycinase [Pontibacter mangrovi]TPE43390.1 cyanophycinase [Pontibacter mangrovi]